LAEYPFLKKTAEYIEPLGLQIDDLTVPGMDQILKRAKERVTEAIIYRRITRDTKKTNAEILSYPVALLLVAATEQTFIKKRFALSEAKQAGSNLNGGSNEKILKVALDFGWKIHLTLNKKAESPDEFTIHFTDYLRNTSHLHDKNGS